MRNRNSRIVLWGGVLAGILAFSIIFFIIFDGRSVGRVLFFPDEMNTGLVGEIRKLPRKTEDEDGIELLVRELILGPVDLSLNPLLPKHTKVRSCMVRDRVVYLDFSSALIVEGAETPFSLDETLFGIEHSIRFNFPSVDGFVFFIDGEMYSPEYGNSGFFVQ